MVNLDDINNEDRKSFSFCNKSINKPESNHLDSSFKKINENDFKLSDSKQQINENQIKQSNEGNIIGSNSFAQ